MSEFYAVAVSTESESLSVRSAPPVQRIVIVIEVSFVGSANTKLISNFLDGSGKTTLTQNGLFALAAALQESCFVDVAAFLANQHDFILEKKVADGSATMDRKGGTVIGKPVSLTCNFLTLRESVGNAQTFSDYRVLVMSLAQMPVSVEPLWISHLSADIS